MLLTDRLPTWGKERLRGAKKSVQETAIYHIESYLPYNETSTRR